MKKSIQLKNRRNGEIEEELVYGEGALHFLYGSPLGRCFAKVIASTPLFSHLYGWWQSLGITKKKIAPFVKKFGVDAREFEKPLDTYPSFNAFFTRKLKPEARPLSEGLILPADARYLFYQDVSSCDGFVVKGKKFSLHRLLGDASLANTYAQGSMILARLCPTDYHRYHFPCACTPSAPRLINGPLYSVNPIAIKQRVEILAENKRMITELETANYGTILFIEVGATNVGSIHQTYTPNKPVKKGAEKGFFSFGGSSIILLFEPNRIKIASDLLNNSTQHIETHCFFGEPIENEL